MKNVKLVLEYDGTGYYGWQIQKDLPTVQGEVESALKKIFKQEIRVNGAGRTDAGTHALGQTANFLTKSKMTEREIIAALNSTLPHNIAVKDAMFVDENFHARFSAKSRLYKYQILISKIRSPLLARYHHIINYEPDIRAMEEAKSFLLGEHDFTAFANSLSEDKSPVKNLMTINIDKPAQPEISNNKLQNPNYVKNGGIHGCMPKDALIFNIPANTESKQCNFLYFTFQADGFLHGMIRNIVSVLLDAGRGKLKPEDVYDILKSKDRTRAPACVPSNGLFLVEVLY